MRGWPIHRWFAVVLLAGMVFPPGSVTVSFGDIWSAKPPVLQLLLAGVQILPLWWVSRQPVLALTVTCVGFFLSQAFAWLATTADMAVFVAVTAVVARTRPRTALASAAALIGAHAVFMVAAQAPGHPEAIVEAIVPSAMLWAGPTMIGLTFRLLRHERGGGAAPAPDAEPIPPRGAEAAAAETVAVGQPGPDRMRLTARELRILTLVAEGLTNTEIAAELLIGRETVKTHIGNILAKLGARDRTHAVTVAHRNRLFDGR